MSFFFRSKQKRGGGKEFSSKIFSSSKKIALRDRKAAVYAGQERHSCFGVIFLWMLFAGTASYALFFSDFLLVENLEADGTQEISREQAERFLRQEISGKHLGLVPRNNFFVIRPARLEVLLRERYPLARTVSVTRIFPHGLKAEFEERKRIVLWCSGDPCYLLDEHGKTSESARALEDENSKHVLFVTDTSAQPLNLGQKIVDEDFPLFVVSVAPLLKEQLGLELENRYATASRFAHELRVKTSEGWEIYLSSDIPLQSSVDALSLFFEKELPAEKRASLKYVDLRTENRIYYVVQGSGEQESQASSESQEKTGTAAADKEKKKKK